MLVSDKFGGIKWIKINRKPGLCIFEIQTERDEWNSLKSFKNFVYRKPGALAKNTLCFFAFKTLLFKNENEKCQKSNLIFCQELLSLSVNKSWGVVKFYNCQNNTKDLVLILPLKLYKEEEDLLVCIHQLKRETHSTYLEERERGMLQLNCKNKNICLVLIKNFKQTDREKYG